MNLPKVESAEWQAMNMEQKINYLNDFIQPKKEEPTHAVRRVKVKARR